MKATEFVKKHGLNLAKEAVFRMPKDWDYCCLRLPDFEFLKRVSSCADCVDMGDLKRLVESYELVEVLGGLGGAKKKLNSLCIFRWITPEIAALEQAIADVEACQ